MRCLAPRFIGRISACLCVVAFCSGCEVCRTTGTREGRGQRLLIGAKRELRSCEILPTFYRNLLPALISKNLDDLLCPPVTVGKCNAFGGERISANLRSLQFPGEAADHMTTLPAARTGFSETHNLEFETQKREIESLSV
jgi:hypothetical protein